MDARGTRLSGMDWIFLAQNTDMWRVVVNTLMNIQVQ
jgi:hypothetical protein